MPKSSSFEVRLAEASAAVTGYYGAYLDELEARDAIILEALDEGWPPSQVARWAKVSHGRVVQIVARRVAEAS